MIYVSELTIPLFNIIEEFSSTYMDNHDKTKIIIYDEFGKLKYKESIYLCDEVKSGYRYITIRVWAPHQMKAIELKIKKIMNLFITCADLMGCSEP